MEELSRQNPAMAALPIDIIFDILARLPVKCLLRSKTVSKSWLTIITSSHFINFHLRRNKFLSSSNQLLIFSSNHDHSLYSVCFESPVNAMELSFFDGGLSFSGIAGSCNGLLLCICNAKTSRSDVCLVNPSTLQYRRIPKLQVPRNFLKVIYGFGYDYIADDYKVVRIVNFVYDCYDGSVHNAREVMVYSLRANSWKFLEEKVCNYATITSTRNGPLINNHLLDWMFWCTSMNEHQISSFDVCSKQWGEVPMPDYVKSGPIRHEKLDTVVDLRDLDGCLCLVTKNFGGNLGDVDVWVMKKYGVKNSWMKLLSMSDMDVARSLKIAPIAYSENGKEILLRRDEESCVFWYDLREKRGRSVEIRGLPDYRGMISTCISSLVSPYGYGRNDDEQFVHQQR
ncbi:hypothetical protein SOVF_193960 [Spinacia oleracea]|nr:hypothetical protein SOVF_193960 [Spinacia oleracea]